MSEKKQEIKELIQVESIKQEISVDLEKNNVDQSAEKELAACLKVSSDTESSCSEPSPKKPVSKTLKTRGDLIRKIKQTSEVLGNQEEVKSMRLHRRRKNSLDGILQEQVARCVQRQAEKHLGIPQEHDKRLEYAVKCLYKFDICVLKIVERVVDYCDFGMTVDGLAQTIDCDLMIRDEMHDALRDFIVEVKEAASPTTRLLLCHLYPLMSVLRQTPKNQQRKEIFPHMSGELAKAKIRSVFRPPRHDSPPSVARSPPPPKLPMSLRSV